MMGIGWVMSLVFGRVVKGKAIFFGFFCFCFCFFFFFGYNLVWLGVG
jgi:hypothetical protein